MPINTRDYIHRFILMDPKYQLVLCEDIEIYALELGNFPKKVEELEDLLEKWIYFLKYGEKIKAEELPSELEVPEIKKAVKHKEAFGMEEAEWQLYESRRIALLDQISMRQEGFEKGFEKGEQKGIKKGIKLGLKSIKLGLKIKFGQEALSAMETIEKIESIEKLESIESILEKASSFKEFMNKISEE